MPCTAGAFGIAKPSCFGKKNDLQTLYIAKLTARTADAEITKGRWLLRAKHCLKALQLSALRATGLCSALAYGTPDLRPGIRFGELVR
jgi:hypothetical protein